MSMENLNQGFGPTNPEMSRVTYVGKEREKKIQDLLRQNPAMTPEEADQEVVNMEISATTSQNIARSKQKGEKKSRSAAA